MIAVRSSRRRAFTMIEILLTISIIAIVAMVVIPGKPGDQTLRLRAAGDILASDLELAQTMTVSFPDDPVVVRFDASGDGYWLAYADAPDTPIARADNGEPYEVTFGDTRTSAAAGVTFIVDDLASNTVIFNEQGGLDDFSRTPKIELRLGGGTNLLTISPATGTTTQEPGGTIGGGPLAVGGEEGAASK